jgi:peptidoglycan/LPS O-acetylase OafA/YrhL
MLVDGGVQSKQYFEKLASLRFFAALLVLGSHLPLTWFVKNTATIFVADDVLWCGFIGVSVFYVLSGFVISFANDRWRGWKGYIIGRVARIYPSHLLVTAALFAYPAYHLIEAISDPKSAALLLTNLGLVHAWIPRANYFFSLNSVSWSLSVEVFFYAAFIFLRRLKDRHIYILAVFGYLANLSAEILLRGHPVEQTHWLFYINPLMRLPEFLLGMSIFRLYRSGALAKMRLPKIEFMLLFVLMIATMSLLRFQGVNQLYFYSSIPALFAFAMIVSLLHEGASRYMKSMFLVLLGESSFMLYLIHKPLVTYPATAKLQIPWMHHIYMALMLVMVIVALSVFCHVFVESKATKFVKKGLSRVFIRKAGNTMPTAP